MKVVWSEQAKESLQNIYFYIYSKSPQNAVSVLDALLALGESLADQNKEFSLDPIINKQKFKHISRWSNKIIYERTDGQVIILDVFDGRQDPAKLFNY